MAVAVRVVPELREHPGAEDDTESGQTEVDASVRVLLKTVCQGGLQLVDLGVQRGDHPDQRRSGVAVGVGDHRRG